MSSTHVQRPAADARRGTFRLVLAVVETAVTAVLATGWLLLAAAMYMESYDLDPSAPGQPDGHAQLAWLAVGVLASVGVTWLLRVVRKPGVRAAADGLIALRMLAVVVVTTILAADLLDG
ncbi:hypothetical protein ABZX98_17000 [Streptomyces sp. NPDC002992]|uniref:hypothetical protein n=1 Tax=Streptomyces sp. NPDC002992 TaxID=3154273 RepID=UPI0033B88605